MNELLLILLPLAAYTGWWLAKSDRKSNFTTAQSDDYFRGLDYLLNDDAENAIATFTKLAQINDNPTSQRDIQHCITLGRLLRKRGEVDRALHLHQSLLKGIEKNPTDFPSELIANIHLSLGDDFIDAGVMNRAVTHLHHALDNGGLDTQRAAGEKLIALHIRQRQWQDAIQVSESLGQVSLQNVAKHIAHCHCECAKAFPEQVETHLQAALRIDKTCVRALAMLANRALAQSQFISAIGHFKRIEHISPQVMIEYLPDIKHAFLSLNQAEEWQRYLTELYTYIPHPNIVLALAQTFTDAPDGSAEKTQAYLESAFEAHPHFRILAEYLKSDIAVSNMLKHIDPTNHTLPFTCVQCGFRTATNQWQCPGCGSLETLRIE